jgi:hypothetical protein
VLLMPHSSATFKLSELRAPGGMRKVANFVAASTQHLKAGRPQATDEQVAERFAICQGCELFTLKDEGVGTCNHPSCGCSLKRVGIKGRNKLRWGDSKCPLEKWLAVEPAGETP